MNDQLETLQISLDDAENEILDLQETITNQASQIKQLETALINAMTQVGHTPKCRKQTDMICICQFHEIQDGSRNVLKTVSS